jgi:hypothetical protein
VALERLYWYSHYSILEPDYFITITRDDLLTIGREGNRADRARVALERL